MNATAPTPCTAQTTANVVCTTRRFQINAPKIKAMAGLICARLGVDRYELAIRLVGSTTIRRLNRDFRQVDKATDVLSFPQLTWAAPAPLRKASKGTASTVEPSTLPTDVLGDLVISLPDAAGNAKRIGQPLDRELGFLLVHGILHLCGYDHLNNRDEQQMRRVQRVLMRTLTNSGGTKPLWTGSVKPRKLRRTHAH